LSITTALIVLACNLHHKMIDYLKARLDAATEGAAKKAVAARMAANAMSANAEEVARKAKEAAAFAHAEADHASDVYVKAYTDNLKAHSELNAHANLKFTRGQLVQPGAQAA
jgi:hypothetical protein